jgi:serine phosphatase RsbU (regulator of sigma subunit)
MALATRRRFTASSTQSTSRLTIVNAGHPAILIRQAQEGVASTSVALGATGPALGLIEAGTFGTHETLAPARCWSAYTDGVSEARDEADAEFGEDR